jgi:1-acyl-sn-glycerol-3-phosphate acyltransferase
MIMAKTEAPVVPVKISGTYKALPKGVTWPKLTEVTVLIGRPLLDLPKSPTEDRLSYKLLSEAVSKAIDTL